MGKVFIFLSILIISPIFPNYSTRPFKYVLYAEKEDLKDDIDFEKMRVQAISQKKFGLFSIMERIKYIGGSIEIDTKPKMGTKIIITMPLSN